MLAVGALGATLASGAATRWSAGGDTPERLARRQVGLALATLSGLVVLAMLAMLYGYHETSYARAVDARGSFFFLFLVFQVLVTALYLVMLVVALVWAWRAPSDPRGLAPAANSALVGYFLPTGWSLVIVTLYLSPRWL